MEQPIYADNLSQRGGIELTLTDAAGRQRTAPSSEPSAAVSPGYLLAKRVLDIFLSLIALAIFFVPLLIIALMIRLESPGPAIYRRRVLALQDWDEEKGPQGLQTFDAYKLRTMIPDADEFLKKNPHLLSAYIKDWKLQSDPRITRFGTSLRSTSIDEIPQLINILKGEMTLVGPRMITAPELARYGGDAPHLLHVKPGLTGLWQVSGRQQLSYEERVRLDMTYIESRSLTLDLQILLKTVICVLRRQGAY